MPWETFKQGQGAASGPSPARPSGSWSSFRQAVPTERIEPQTVEPTETDNSTDSGPGWGTIAAAGAGVLGAAALASKMSNMPGMLGKIGKGAGIVNAARQQLMLSGLAVPKSLLGNVGAGIEAAAEGKGFGALKEILSLRTAKDAVRAMKTPTAAANNPVGTAGVVDLPGWASIPGRMMGGADEATRAALQRAGSGVEEAASQVLQRPLSENYGPMGSLFESPLARWLFPFRRTPFNQFAEGMKRLPLMGEGTTKAKAMYMGAGAVHGGATADEQYPVSVPVAVAASARYGLPYALAALAGRRYLGGRKDSGNIPGAALPVSEYGVSQGITDPLAGFEPAILRVMKRMAGED